MPAMPCQFTPSHPLASTRIHSIWSSAQAWFHLNTDSIALQAFIHIPILETGQLQLQAQVAVITEFQCIEIQETEQNQFKCQQWGNEGSDTAETWTFPTPARRSGLTD